MVDAALLQEGGRAKMRTHGSLGSAHATLSSKLVCGGGDAAWDT
jgi:hypothetical protein